jgi:transcriptional regulator with XRE-family HTH domain
MTALGRLIRDTREAKGWRSREALADRAGQLPNAPVITADDVRLWETRRLYLELEQGPKSKLPWIVAALELSDEEICWALGLGSGRRAA